MSESLTLLPGFKSHLGQLLPVSVSHCRSAVRLRQTRTGPPALENRTRDSDRLRPIGKHCPADSDSRVAPRVQVTGPAPQQA